MSFNCTNFFLTYPHLDATKDELIRHLSTLTTPRGVPLPVIYIRVCREQHADGTPHMHALVCCEQRYRASKNFFDYQRHHCNIQGARSIGHVKEYLEKEGDWTEWGVPPVITKKRSYGEILSEAQNQGEFLQAVTTHYPRDMVLNHERIIAFAQYHYKPPAPVYVPTFDAFNLPDILTQWRVDNLQGPFEKGFRRRSLIIVSPSRFGKTEWARSLGPHLYWNGMFDLSTFCSNVSYGVFDDFDWDTFSRFHKQWMGCQREFTLTDKYRKKMTVQWGLPIIYLCNADMQPVYSDWIRANCEIVFLNEPLF